MWKLHMVRRRVYTIRDAAMKIEKQKGKFIVSLTPKEAEDITSEFDDLITLRDEFDPSENGPRAAKLAALIDKLGNVK